MDIPRTIRWGLVAVGVGTVVLAGCSSGSASRGSSVAAPSTASMASSAAPATSAPPAPPVRLRVERTALGTVLADPRGFTLYTFKLDKSGTNACTGACATTWPPFTVGAGVRALAPTGSVGTLATITRAGGPDQVSFAGRPLYRFSGDTAPGQTHGEDVQGLWFVVRIGAAPHASTMSAQPAPRTTSLAPTHTTHPAPSHSATPSRTPTTHPPKPSPSPTNCIPQGGGGDGDGDNNGGPSDGDGCT